MSWRDGTIEITSSTSNITLLASDARILDLVHFFARPKYIVEVVDAWAHLPRSEVIACIDELIDARVLVTETSVEPTHWDPTALAYHQLSRSGSPVADGEESACTHVPGSGPPLIPLGPPAPPRNRDFADVLIHRRSTRAWPKCAIERSTFSTLLSMSAANRSDPFLLDDGSTSRPYPSGGAVYSLELYPVIDTDAIDSVDAGVYRYRPDHHALELLAAGAAASKPFLTSAAEAVGTGRPPVVLVISSRIASQSQAYHQIAYSLVLKEVGALFQTLYLVCEFLGLSACALGGGSPDGALAELRGEQIFDNPVVGEFALGPRGSGPARQIDGGRI
ncbi:SagB family peptide dehydrogenase [Mycobacterium decipiens]|uniref:SagB family peptide dehydrogenase n=1 Tax=Mycobacterium decipiens TaxID=1430326 RepID=UPI0013FDEBEA|nr:SagB family peptide dehydrogenase [Mycobacterium decipiens]